MTAFQSITPERRIALLIDADNISHNKIAAILAELSKYGVANIRRAYGDWTNPGFKGWTEKLHEHAIRPVQQFSYSSGKNATDMALVVDAMELLYTQRLDAFAVASSDADLTPLVMHLRANGHQVHGFGDRKTPDPFVNACSTFLYLDSLVPESTDVPPVAVTAGKQAETVEPVGKPQSGAKPLSQDTQLVTTLRGAVQASAGDDGWAHMGAAGSAAKRLASIDPRNYKCKNFPRLFEAVGLFDIVKGADGHPYVSDKRNKERSPAPTS